MHKLVVVAKDPVEERVLWQVAHRAARTVDRSSVRVVRRRSAWTAAQRLDRALFERPLADALVVVGRRWSGPQEAERLLDVLLRAPALGAVTIGAPLDPSLDDLLEAGGAFRAGALCQVGGFAGDGSGALQDRLLASGWASAVVPPTTAVRLEDRWAVSA